ncbi:DUF2169 domain-containing protein [Providencia rettgeri]|uniref:DUF2169 family type VI secretion system accessory protein n=1 Tax=Providencia TaxID=586 RepID=UPI000BC909BB|nr:MULTISPECIES: DUF2169 domain-containing protein [Providencia]MBW3104927.1 DUF2169 domain-containing protein [Providencia rettgeri]PCQ37880.1 hypothetical protein CQA26_11020 [Providencia rettgeri]BBU95317.1 hypothetical protein BML2496_12000 [Providencia rettgeri]
MELINNAKHTTAKATVMIDKAGFEYLVVVMKASYHLPDDNQLARPIIPPKALAYTDTYTGEVGTSVPLYDADFVLRKHKCDVIFNANAFAPNAEPTQHLMVSVQVGEMKKSLSVIGYRQWQQGTEHYTAGDVTPFTTVPLHYGFAFGGQYHFQDEMISHSINPLGRGYFSLEKPNGEMMMPQLENPKELVDAPDNDVKPIALSVLPRHYGERVKYAGTFDDKWRNETAPFLPDDFDECYFQSVPDDQQIDFPVGNEVITLTNIHPTRPEIHFKLPRLNNIPVRLYQRDGEVVLLTPKVDTLYFEPEKNCFSVIWRCHHQIRTIQDVEQVLVGPLLDSYVSRQAPVSTCRG